MPRDFVLPGTGPSSLDKHLVTTVRTPGTTTSAAPIRQMQPLKWGRVSPTTGAASTTGLGRTAVLCVDGDVPELISNEYTEQPYDDISVSVLGAAGVVGDKSRANFIEQVPITGSPATGTDLGVLADAFGSWKVVSAATGIGRVIDIIGNTALVLF